MSLHPGSLVWSPQSGRDRSSHAARGGRPPIDAHAAWSAWAIAWMLSAVFIAAKGGAQTPAHDHDPSDVRATIVLNGLPAGWTAQSVRMDEIWQPLGVRGMNYYAFGKPVSPIGFAARSDPTSPAYQGWLGAYVVAGAGDVMRSRDQSKIRQLLTNLAENDQRAWLAGMGDSAPVATWTRSPHVSSIVIDGVARPLYVGDMHSHSDLSAGVTPLAERMGMPPTASWQDQVTAFHDVVLHVQAAIWYDQLRDVTIVVYGASSAFTSRSGAVRDNGPVLDDSLRHAMQRVRVTDPAPGTP